MCEIFVHSSMVYSFQDMSCGHEYALQMRITDIGINESNGKHFIADEDVTLVDFQTFFIRMILKINNFLARFDPIHEHRCVKTMHVLLIKAFSAPTFCSKYKTKHVCL